MARRVVLILGALGTALSAPNGFLGFSKSEMCAAEPTLAMCRGVALSSPSSNRSPDPDDLWAFGGENRDPAALRSGAAATQAPERKEGFIAQKAPIADDKEEDPFSDIVTRAPPGSQSSSSSSSSHREETEGRHRHHHRRKHYRNQQEYYNDYYRRHYAGGGQRRQHMDPSTYIFYPGMHPKNDRFCADMRASFAFTCQPSKPLRLDLNEFCKDYSAFCNVPNFHRMPGPRMGPPPDKNSPWGNVGINGKFGLGVGAVPGFDVGVGWGVDVGPIPGMTEDVGVDLGLDLGLVGSKSPIAYRRGMDNPNEKGGGIFGIQGGVGVKAPGSGPIGVGSGVGVGK